MATPVFELPLLEDANAVQITIQEVMQSLLDNRLDARRAGLLLYSLQLASTNLRALRISPRASEESICTIGDDDMSLFNDCVGTDPRDEKFQRQLEEQRALPPASPSQP